MLADLSDVDMVLTEERVGGRRREVTVTDLSTMDGQVMVNFELRGSKRGTNRDFCSGGMTSSLPMT